MHVTYLGIIIFVNFTVLDIFNGDSLLQGVSEDEIQVANIEESNTPNVGREETIKEHSEPISEEIEPEVLVDQPSTSQKTPQKRTLAQSNIAGNTHIKSLSI